MLLCRRRVILHFEITESLKTGRILFIIVPSVSLPGGISHFRANLNHGWETTCLNSHETYADAAAPQARLKRKTFFYQTTPMFLMTIHYFLPSDISLSQFTRSLRTDGAELLRRRRHILRFELTESSKLLVFAWPHSCLSLKIFVACKYQSDMTLVSLLLCCRSKILRFEIIEL